MAREARFGVSFSTLPRSLLGRGCGGVRSSFNKRSSRRRPSSASLSSLAFFGIIASRYHKRFTLPSLCIENMATQKQTDAANLYRSLMHEARIRIDLFNHILSGGTKLPEAMVHELCYLNMRMICELVALGCLVIHYDISENSLTKKLKNEWHAEKIIERLHALHPHSFPQQAEVSEKGVTGNTNNNALSRDEFFKIYGKCGDALHRGTLKKILKTDKAPYGKIHLPDIVRWIQKVEDLLGCHLVVMADGKTIVVCVLRDLEKNFETTTAIIEYQAPSQ